MNATITLKQTVRWKGKAAIERRYVIRAGSVFREESAKGPERSVITKEEEDG